MIQTVHARVRGRARFRVTELYRSEPVKFHLEKRLQQDERISEVSASSVTGTVLVRFHPTTPLEEIASVIGRMVQEFKRGVSLPDPSPSWSCVDPDPAGPGSVSSPPPGALKRQLNRLSGILSHGSQLEKPWHTLDAAEVLDLVEGSPDCGLSGVAARKQLKRYGPNALPESSSRSRLAMFFGQFNSLPVALLGVAAGVSLLTGGMADAVVILGVVGINALIGFVTENETERTIQSLKHLAHPSARVVRDGAEREIDIQEVVPGDLLVLRPGTYVPADARLLEAQRLSVDESALTGESLPVTKDIAPLARENTPLADRLNMVFMGTFVTGGQGLAVVVATGRHSEIGRLQMLVGEAKAPETPMERQLNRMGNQLVAISGAVCGVVFLVGLLRGQGLLQMFKMSISLAVAAVPEGLPTVATTTLALGIRTMKAQKLLIRKLDVVETLGAVQTICFDKTGTVTQNRMSVQDLILGNRRIRLSEGRFFEGSEPFDPQETDDLMRLIHVAALCNESQVVMEGPETILQGSSTENALITMAILAGVNVTELRHRYPTLKTNHRSEDRHFMGTLHETGEGGKLIAMKGSPLEILSLCNRRIQDGMPLDLTEEDRIQIEKDNEHMAADALRVLGFAYVDDASDADFDNPAGLIWLGLIGMADPVRPGVKALIPLFHQAGIDTIMITGDQSPTAYAIGKELRLSQDEPLEILDSTHLNAMDADALRALCQRVHVFARVSPANKLEIVQALQTAGRVVAMTGDGINDGPALKAADIGVALGCTGTNMAREVADVVLEDDNLETMILAVSHGRTIYSNIRKSLHFLLSTNFSEIMVMFLATAAGLGMPLSAMQLLWINLISDIFPGLALALEPPEPDVLKRPPRDPNEPIVKPEDFKRVSFESGVISVSTLGAYAYGISRHGTGITAGTIAFQTLTMAQLLHAISCRSEKHSIFSSEKLPPNRYLSFSLIGSFVLQLLTLVVPSLRNLLGLGRVGLVDGLVIGGGAVLPLLVNEATKNPSQGANS